MFRSGIVGIERKLQEKVESQASNISVAFQDMKNLIDMAKEMVHLASCMSTKIKERQGVISDDETVKFKSYLMSLGIEDPVTKVSFTSNDTFHEQLAKEIAKFLLKYVSNLGEAIPLSDAYCRVNRARGLDLVSPEDFFRACHLLPKLNLPVSLHRFESGIQVLQLHSTKNSQLEDEIVKLLQVKQKLTDLDLSQQLRISIVLAREQLLNLEKNGLACRDDTITGLVFYQNLFCSDILAHNI